MMRESTAKPTMAKQSVAIRLAMLLGVALVACLIECKFVLAIQTRIGPEDASRAAPTISLGGGDLGNAFVFHAALNGNEITATRDCQLILGLENTLADKRYVAMDPWERLELRVTDGAGVVATWPVLEGATAPKARTDLPELVDALDVASTHAGYTTIQYPHHVGVYAINLTKSEPDWTTFRAKPDTFRVLTRPGRYRLQIIYDAPEGARTLCDYPDLWVR